MESGLESIPNFERRLPSNEILEYICSMILDLDPNIRFVGVINNKGKLLTGQTKKGILVSTDPKDQEMLLMETALGIRMRKEHDSHLGSVKFTISYSDKIMLTFPLGDEILCISAEQKINFMAVSFLILKFLEANLDAIVKKDSDK